MVRVKRLGAGWMLPLWCALLTLLMLAPTLRPGFVLVYDMVFTPRQPLLPQSVGLDSALPRAVPADAVVALLSFVVPGDVLQKAILLGTVFFAAWGAGRLVPAPPHEHRTGARIVAATWYGWNAYLAERLLLGHWTLLVGYACLPWIVAAALRMRHDEPRAWARLVLACAPAVLVPTAGILAVGAALAAAGRRKALPVLGTGLVLNAPWLVPGALRPGLAVSDPEAVDAFASRGEGPGGPLASVLSLGGIWNADTVPSSRISPLPLIVAVLLTAAAGYAALALGRAAAAPDHTATPPDHADTPGHTATARNHAATTPGRTDTAVPAAPVSRSVAQLWVPAPARALGVLALGGVLLALAGALPGTGGGLRWAVEHVPGAGLLRDGQKWTAWWALLSALGCAMAVSALAARLPVARVAVLAGAALLPIAVLPDLAWGAAGRLEPVRYPADWSAVRAVLSDRPGRGDVLVLPFQAYRSFGWNDGRPQLDPAPRMLPVPAVIDDSLRVDGRDLHGEDLRAARVRAALAERAPLGPFGIGWVLVERGTAGAVDETLLSELTPVYEGQWLRLYRVPGAIARRDDRGPPALPVLVADVGALTMVGFALLRRRLLIGRLKSLSNRGLEG